MVDSGFKCCRATGFDVDSIAIEIVDIQSRAVVEQIVVRRFLFVIFEERQRRLAPHGGEDRIRPGQY